jgi:predicted enzyme related to lactoylglutathione lyase
MTIQTNVDSQTRDPQERPRSSDESAQKSGPRRSGEFCWINILTPQPALARDFFGTLLGWTYFEIPGVGHGIKAGGVEFGGLFDLESPNTPPGARPELGVMVKVESADATCEKTVTLGGRAKPTFDINGKLRMAVCADPNGASFDVWEAKHSHGTEILGTQPGAPSWFELMTTDVTGAAKFYSELFGWTTDVAPLPGSTYTTFKLGPLSVAGMLELTPQMGNQRPQWVTYFTVTDAEATAREAVTLGAVICRRVRDVPGTGRFCGITSPQGITFCVVEYAN